MHVSRAMCPPPSDCTVLPRGGCGDGVRCRAWSLQPVVCDGARPVHRDLRRAGLRRPGNIAPAAASWSATSTRTSSGTISVGVPRAGYGRRTIRREFLTTALWGVGSTPRYEHDGRASTSGGDPAARREARAARDAFALIAAKSSAGHHHVSELAGAFHRTTPRSFESDWLDPVGAGIPAEGARQHQANRALQQPCKD